MSTRIKSPQSLGRDYKQMLKNYFGRYLYGLQVEENGGCVEAQVVYYDFKHISTVRRELAQMMPEVEFIKIKRDFTDDAERWALLEWYGGENSGRENIPVVYVQRGDSLVKSSLRDILLTELNQTEFGDDDIKYLECSILHDCKTFDDQRLRENSWD